MSGQKPDKKELAEMKVMSDMGASPTSIARKMQKSHNTVIKYLRSDVFTDPQIQQIVEKIKDKELEDLYLLGAKGRKRLHELLDGGKTRPIETIALVDRVFQQRRLLEGRSTSNISNLTKVILEAHKPDTKKAENEAPDKVADQG